MFEGIIKFFKRIIKSNAKEVPSKETAKERLHLVLMQDRANVSVDFLELMKQEIIEVIKKYIEVDESAIDVRLTNEVGEDGTQKVPSLYANIPILAIRNDVKDSKTQETKLSLSEPKGGSSLDKDGSVSDKSSSDHQKRDGKQIKETDKKVTSSGDPQKKDKKKTDVNGVSLGDSQKKGVKKTNVKSVPSDSSQKKGVKKTDVNTDVNNHPKKDNNKNRKEKNKTIEKSKGENATSKSYKQQKT